MAGEREFDLYSLTGELQKRGRMQHNGHTGCREVHGETGWDIRIGRP